jgi:uncharacterized protein VirK/YbjX
MKAKVKATGKIVDVKVHGMDAYLTKKKKPTKNGPQTISQDRRPITEGEMIGLFEFYLRKWCEEHEGEDTVVITNSNGKKIFEATLLDKG